MKRVNATATALTTRWRMFLGLDVADEVEHRCHSHSGAELLDEPAPGIELTVGPRHSNHHRRRDGKTAAYGPNHEIKTANTSATLEIAPANVIARTESVTTRRAPNQ